MLAGASRLELEVARAARERGEHPRFRFSVKGESMRPSLLPGMRVVVEVVPAGELNEGDLVCWYRKDSRDGQKVIHRLVRATSDAIITRGDALGYDDEPPLPEPEDWVAINA